MRHTQIALTVSCTSFARALSCWFVTEQSSIYCTCLITVTWQTEEGIILLYFIVPIQAFITLPSSDIRFTYTLPSFSVAHSSRKWPWDVTLASLTASSIQPIKVVHAGVTLKSLYFTFTIALSSKRDAKLVHWAIDVALTGITSIFIDISESFKSKITMITLETWQEKSY